MAISLPLISLDYPPDTSIPEMVAGEMMTPKGTKQSEIRNEEKRF